MPDHRAASRVRGAGGKAGLHAWIKGRERLRIIDHLTRVGTRRPTDVLEWGCGGSTALFSRILQELGGPATWIAIDHDADWIARARAASPGWVEFLHVPTGSYPNRAAVRAANAPAAWDRYVDPPDLAGQAFDLILVDGRMRRRCLLRARTLLRDDASVVLLHDAQRAHYHCALGDYDRGTFETPLLWSGHKPSGVS